MPLLTCIFLLYQDVKRDPRAGTGAAPPRPPSARCMLTERMHMHRYVQKNLAPAISVQSEEPKLPHDCMRKQRANSVVPPAEPPALSPRLRSGERSPPRAPPPFQDPSARSSPRTTAPSSTRSSTNPVNPAVSSRVS